MAFTEEKLAELRKTYGRIETTTYNGVNIAFKVPTQLDMQMWNMGGDTNERDANLARLVVVAPDLPAFNALLIDYPAMMINKKVGNALARAMGILESTEGKG